MKLSHSLPIALCLTVVGCTSGDPLVNMCQAVAKQLTSNTISEWGDTDKSGDDRRVNVVVNYTNNAGAAGKLDCEYKKNKDGTVKTSPDKVALNGQTVDNKTLISAGVAASKELISGAYKETVEKAEGLTAEALKEAGEAAIQKANELTGQ